MLFRRQKKRPFWGAVCIILKQFLDILFLFFDVPLFCGDIFLCSTVWDYKHASCECQGVLENLVYLKIIALFLARKIDVN